MLPKHSETDREKIKRLERRGVRSGKDTRDLMKLVAKGKIILKK